MNYYFNKKFAGIEFEEGIEMVTEELKKEGFGVLTEVDVKATFKKKLDIDFHIIKDKSGQASLGENINLKIG